MTESPQSPGIWVRIKEHKVAQWLLAYLALAYTLVQGVAMLSEALDWPHGLIRLITLVPILGIPVTAFLAWYHGAHAQRRVSGVELTMLTVLFVIAGTVMWVASRSDEHREGTDRAAAPDAATKAAVTMRGTVSERSIAVLPFVDMSEKKDQEYFSDGLSEQLIDLLAKIPELHVSARTSSFYFKGKQTTIPDIARALGVAHVLEGSVRKSGNTLRITAQLIRVDHGYHLWSETYDRQLDDIFKDQDDIAGAVVKALKVSLLGAEVPRVAPTANTQAYTLYLQRDSRINPVAKLQGLAGAPQLRA